MTVPRRPRPGPEDRAHTILTQTHGAPSAQGSTAAARPVTAQRKNRQYVPPTPGKVFDRLSVGFRVDDMSTIPASPFYLPGYTFTDEAAVGTSVALNSPDDGGIYTFAEGVYAVNLWLRVAQIEAADPSFSMRLQAQVADPFLTEFGCGVRGGDSDGAGGQLFSATSRTYYMTGNGLSGGIFPRILYSNLDPVITGIIVEVQVQRIT